MVISTRKRQKPTKCSWSDYLNMRYISLICLTLQTTSIITVYSYSRKIPKGSTKYLSSTVVVLAEILKLAVCFLVILKESGKFHCERQVLPSRTQPKANLNPSSPPSVGYSLNRCLRTLNKDIFCNIKESIKVLVPAALYALQNNLAFYALTNLEPATYQVAYQLKILFTAMFSVLLVNKRIRRKQWLALLLLTTGVYLVQSSQDEGTRTIVHEGEKNRFLGLLSVIACCMSSGFSGVYFERLIKFSANQSLWIRNFQLAIFCLTISTFGMFYQDYQAIQIGGFLQGYSYLTWIVVFLQAFGGLIVASVVKYADNVLKGFATSMSIIFSTLLSYYLFDNFNPSMYFYIGASTVIISTFMYSL